MLCDGSFATADLQGFYLDRFAVTNRQYQRFVVSGAYDDLQIWPSEVWPSVTAHRSIRASRPQGLGERQVPRGQGRAPGRRRLLVRGRCLCALGGQAAATAAEWQKAGGWPEQLSGGTCNRYPWGNMFEPERTNLSASGVGQTSPVRDYPSGTTPNGIYQMTGNVWEWLEDPLETIPCQRGEYSQSWKPSDGSSAEPSTPISPARRPVSSSPAKGSSIAATHRLSLRVVPRPAKADAMNRTLTIPIFPGPRWIHPSCLKALPCPSHHS